VLAVLTAYSKFKILENVYVLLWLTFNDIAQQCIVMQHVYSVAGLSLHFFSTDIVTPQVQTNLIDSKG
jgi:hypothetical protein